MGTVTSAIGRERNKHRASSQQEPRASGEGGGGGGGSLAGGNLCWVLVLKEAFYVGSRAYIA